MKQNLCITNLRCSIFVPKVAYNGENITKMMGAFPGFLPSTLNINALPLQILGLPDIQQNLSNQPWQLKSADNMESIMFYDDKIDIILNFNKQDYSFDFIKEKSLHCSVMFDKIINTFNFTSVRIAIAPTLRIPFGEGSNLTKSYFLSKVFELNSFEGASVDNCDFSQVFRINRQVKDKSYLINHLAKFNTERVNQIKNNMLTTTEYVVLSIDINTFVNPTYNMDLDVVKAFFNESPKWSDDLINFYFA